MFCDAECIMYVKLWKGCCIYSSLCRIHSSLFAVSNYETFKVSRIKCSKLYMLRNNLANVASYQSPFILILYVINLYKASCSEHLWHVFSFIHAHTMYLLVNFYFRSDLIWDRSVKKCQKFLNFRCKFEFWISVKNSNFEFPLKTNFLPRKQDTKSESMHNKEP